ncbi:SDR family NAD(P)-dependent oxidoreductase [Sphingomonas sp. GlSt437]|uniref:SDR family NAD(P)-dependent oxidoreductase n=1 Tax=Sphingomonas sp. GlSt437 TaxID=3389970 RepID=UPI003A891546
MVEEARSTSVPYRTALIVGTGPGISASVARALAADGVKVAVAARNTGKLAALADETRALAFTADATDPAAVARLFEQVEAAIGVPDMVLYNASGRVRGPIVELDPEEVRRAIEISAWGGFLVVQQAAKRLLPLGRGAILLTGATASVKGFAQSSAFAIGKFGLRGLAQSAARELAPKGIHVAHFVIDGGVRSATRPDLAGRPDATLDPDAIAQSYLDVLRQPRSAWSWEIELRPWVENF